MLALERSKSKRRRCKEKSEDHTKAASDDSISSTTILDLSDDDEENDRVDTPECPYHHNFPMGYDSDDCAAHVALVHDEIRRAKEGDGQERVGDLRAETSAAAAASVTALCKGGSTYNERDGSEDGDDTLNSVYESACDGLNDGGEDGGGGGA